MTKQRRTTHGLLFFGLLATAAVVLIWWGFADGADSYRGARAEAASVRQFTCDDAAVYAGLIPAGGINFLMTYELELTQGQQEALDQLLDKTENLSVEFARLCRNFEAVTSADNLSVALDSFQRSLVLTGELTAKIRPELEAFYESLDAAQQCELGEMMGGHRGGGRATRVNAPVACSKV